MAGSRYEPSLAKYYEDSPSIPPFTKGGLILIRTFPHSGGFAEEKVRGINFGYFRVNDEKKVFF